MTPQAALEYAKRFLGHMPLDDVDIKYRILDDANRKLWMAAPWPWSVDSLEVVTLANDTQEYNLAAHSDLLCLQQVDLTNGQEKHDLNISAILPVTTSIKGRPSQVMYVPGSPQKLRFLPVPTGYASPYPTVRSVYKKKSTAIAAGNYAEDYSVTTGVHDEWFWVYQEIVLLKAFQFAHDPRLGNVQFSNGQAVFTGQYAVVEAAIAEMRRGEEKFFKTLGEVVDNA